jgi:hypothetical protein
MNVRLLLTRRPALAVTLLVVSMVAGLAPAAPAPAASTCTDDQKPDVFRVEDMTPGTMGTGWTVVQGREPVSFDVEILGVLPDGILPGIDFVLIKVSGPVIDQTGGIAFGMSGSPVFVGDELAGAVAFGFFAADQTIGGMMPAEAMVPIFDYPGGAAALQAARAFQVKKVELDSSLRRVAAREAGVATAEFPSVARQLLIPMSFSGLNDRAMRKVNKLIKRLGLPFVPYKGNAVGNSEALAEEPLGPGDAVAATISTGDLTSAGVGTTTAVCGNLSLHFGHPFFFDGASTGVRSMGMNAAEVLTVVPDPSNLFGPFKIANIAELHGVIDQDRISGIRGVEGVLPTSVPIVTDVLNPDLGKFRRGRTDVIKQEFADFSILPFLAAFHLLLNQDVMFDRIGDGTVNLSFTIDGTAPSGEPFSLVRDNMWFSDFDVSFLAILELLLYLAVLDDFDPDVKFSGVDADSIITEEHITAEIETVFSASSVARRLREREFLPVRRGDTIRLRVFLRPEGSETLETVDLVLQVPRRVRGDGVLRIRGGGEVDCFFCILFDGEEGEGEEEEPQTFEELLAELEGAEQNNDLLAELRIGGRQRTALSQRERVVLGQERIEIFVVS